nr:MAG TPA_asm: hypothetical protein [Caudoviricetes sp.]
MQNYKYILKLPNNSLKICNFVVGIETIGRL